MAEEVILEDRVVRAIEVIGKQLTRIADAMGNTVAIVDPTPAPAVDADHEKAVP